MAWKDNVALLLLLEYQFKTILANYNPFFYSKQNTIKISALSF